MRGDQGGAMAKHALRTLPATATCADWHAALTPGSLPSASYPQGPQLHGSATAKKRRTFA